ncbi:hypothetical protein CYMTET_45402 [Cymbomonas tetramitiformis]|uniref:U2A'/phosphoprotein 32 family A C-terminal domain-containing protein n=1 Tax=Cymbomonas tetramitiformis TaxID=36881 RepID=A0AAE0C035_9CHLO|nr:hypothetical protein CYMTET_45402 [Cymbomonas tetramitiformis]
MVTLSEEVVLSKTKANSLDRIRNLNLWGSDLSDVSVIARMANVEVLSLSVNRVKSLAHFEKCSKLSELYLRKNEVGCLSQVHHLKGLKNLRVLWLCDNPCAEEEDYRLRVIRQLPQLTKLDHANIGDEERDAAKNAKPIPTSQSDADPSPASSPAPVPAKETAPSPPANAGKSGTSNNVLYAVMALIAELDEEALSIVKTEIEQRIDSLK